MKAEVLKRIRIERYLFGIIMAFVMVFVAEISHETEIIFPEICALIIGAWVSEQQPWATNKRRIFILMSLAALFGVLVVKFCTYNFSLYITCLSPNRQLGISDISIIDVTYNYFGTMAYGKISFSTC